MPYTEAELTAGGRTWIRFDGVPYIESKPKVAVGRRFGCTERVILRGSLWYGSGVNSFRRGALY